MRQKINYKNALFQLSVGVLAYFLFIKEKIKPKKPIITVGDVDYLGLDYEPVYFQDVEYFGSNEKPEIYRSNYSKLIKILDQIRVNFGSAVLISKGYEKPVSGMILNGFQNCTVVQIQPQNKDISRLNSVVKDLIVKGQIIPKEAVLLTNNQIKITIDGY